MLFPSQSFAQREINVAEDGNYAPYYLGTNEGIERDIFSQILNRMNMKPVYWKLPLYRMRNAIQRYQLDASLTSFKPKQKPEGVYLSNPYIYYSNVIICNEDLVGNIRSLSDLKGVELAGWQDAHQVMGEEYKKLFVPGTNNYFELPSLKSLLLMFFRGRLECLALDKFVILWFVKHDLASHNLQPINYKFYQLFDDRTYFHVQFKNKHVRDQFNRALSGFRADGSLRRVYEKYLGTDNPDDLIWSGKTN